MNSCRLCLKNFLPSQKHLDIHTLKDKLQLVFSFEINTDEQFSEFVCPACVATVSLFYKYAYEVQQNQLKLRNAVQGEFMELRTSPAVLKHEQNFTLVSDIKVEPTNKTPVLQKPILEAETLSSSAEQRMELAFGSILTDFSRDLEGYEPLPNMQLAFKGDPYEKQKLYDIQDYLMQTYFSLNCEICSTQLVNQRDRRLHFSQNHPNEKHFVSCCNQRFLTRISIMRHMNRHLKRVIESNATVKHVKSCTQGSAEAMETVYDWPYLENKREIHSTYSLLIKEYRDELIAGGFNIPFKLPEKVFEREQQLIHQMQDFLIAKHACLNCELCGIHIQTYLERQEHFRTNHPEQVFFVKCCGSKFCKRYDICLHLIRHKKGLPVKSARGLRHVPAGTHGSENVLIEAYYKMDCELCDYTGNSYLGLRTHFSLVHKDEAFFITCCNRRFRTRSYILEHIASHKTPNAVKCEQCQQTFANDRSLKGHMILKHVSEEKKLFRCDHCSEAFATKHLLVIHCYKHEQATCDICGLEMKRSTIRVHKVNVHKMGEEIVCHVCARVYYSKYMFNKHFRTSHLKIRKKYNNKRRKSRAKKKLPVVDECQETATAVYTINADDLASLVVLQRNPQ
ncbi:PR domain zinc finger protein 15-like [Wyeomyia smithii]|uniref:PR domain zinc finger protein 15-like n=1 Tax=Wyeomyia smithii TaxID=174621 RepID=UPI002467EEB4|nr:PR domain zinc finger protein 15-like [Wyeomyia smithii]